MELETGLHISNLADEGEGSEPWRFDTQGSAGKSAWRVFKLGQEGSARKYVTDVLQRRGAVAVQRPPEQPWEPSALFSSRKPESGAEWTLGFGTFTEARRAAKHMATEEATSSETHSSSSDPDPGMSQTPDMTREELKAHLDANQARIEQIAENVGAKVDRLDDRMEHMEGRLDERMGHIEEKQLDVREDVRSTRSTFVLGTLALAALLVTLIGFGYNRLGDISDRVFENVQRIEQVDQQPRSGPTDASPADSATATSN